jgi:hypothetical protein
MGGLSQISTVVPPGFLMGLLYSVTQTSVMPCAKHARRKTVIVGTVDKTVL